METPEIHVPLYFYFLSGRVAPTEKQMKLLCKREIYGGPLDGVAAQMPNLVDWSRSDVNLSPLVPWLGNPDFQCPRNLMKRLEAKYPELRGQLEIIKLEVEIIGEGYQWGDLYQIRTVE